MEQRRVVITGLGAVTPLGLTAEDSWQAVRRGVCGIGPITHYDASAQKVKLAAEVSDLSEAMRSVLDYGTARIIARLTRAIEAGVADGSLASQPDASAMATTLYQLWLGASLRAKITRDRVPLESALTATRGLLGLPAAVGT